jgi:hypothetical protein
LPLVDPVSQSYSDLMIDFAIAIALSVLLVNHVCVEVNASPSHLFVPLVASTSQL